MQHYVLTSFVDSDPETGASNINDLGSQFTVNLQTPLIIPKNAMNCNLKVINATIWFVTPNIILEGNSAFSLTYNGITYEIDIPTGLYDVNTLSAKIQTELNLVSEGQTPIDIIQLLEDVAENKVVIQFNYYNIVIDFRDNLVPNNIRTILGFNSRLIQGFTNPPGTDPIPFYEEGDNVASFNNTDYYLIKCSDLVSRGLERNSQYRGILARVDIDVSVNSKIVYDPRQVPMIPAPELVGIDKDQLTFQLTNQNDELVDTRGEFWSLIYEIHYDLPIENITEAK